MAKFCEVFQDFELGEMKSLKNYHLFGNSPSSSLTDKCLRQLTPLCIRDSIAHKADGEVGGFVLL